MAGLPKVELVFFPFSIIFSLLAFALGVVALSEYINQRNDLEALVPKAKIYDTAYIVVTSYNTFTSIFSAAVLGSLFVASLVRRTTASASRPFWKLLSVVAAVFGIADALALTVITATRAVSYDNVGPRVTVYMDEAVESEGVPLKYRDDSKSVAAVVFAWLACCCAMACCVFMFYPKSASESPSKEEVSDEKTVSSASSI